MACEEKGDNSDTHGPSLPMRTVLDIYSRYVRENEALGDSEKINKIKTLALDIFLAQCYRCEQKTGEFPRLYSMKSVVNQLCQEFMNDIIRVTSGQDDEDSDDEDPAALQRYMLEGRGWLLLYILYKNGIQTLTVSREFGKLLVSLLPWCLKFDTVQSSKDESAECLWVNKDSLYPISDCFCNLNKSAKWRKANKHREKAIPHGLHKDGEHKSKDRETLQNKKYKKQAVDKMDNISSESEHEEQSKTEGRKIRRRGRLFRHSYIADQQLANQQNSNDEEEEEEMKLLMSTADVKNNLSTTPQHLCSLMVELIQEIAYLDLNQTSSAKIISTAILPNLLHVFSNFYPKHSSEGNVDLMASDWKNCDRILLQRKLLRLILTLSGIIATHQNGVNILVGHKFTSVLLDLAQQVYRLQKIKRELKVTSNKPSIDSSAFPVDFVLVSEIVFGFIMCLDNVFMCLPLNLVHIQNAVHLVEDFDDCHGFELMEYIICSFDKSEKMKSKTEIDSDWLDEEPIKIISSFLNTLKSVKVNYIHSMKCLKRKHHKCQYSYYFDHHHNILGLPASLNEREGPEISSDSSSQNTTTCLIASWCGVFLDLLPKISSKFMQVELIRVIQSSSICCCMTLETLVKGILGSLACFSPAVKSYALDTLNQIIIELFSFDEKPQRKENWQKSFSCQNCLTFPNNGVKYQEKLRQSSVEHIDSGFSSRGKEKLVFENTEMDSKWPILGEFKSLLFSKDQSMAEIVAKHLFYLSIHGSIMLKEELFSRVYIYAFSSFLGSLKVNPQSSSEEDVPPMVEFSKEVKLHCLSALPYLLQVESVLKTFLTKRGIGNICKLLEDFTLRAPVLKVFEALVILDEQKLAHKRFLRTEELTASGQERNSNEGMVIKAFLDGLARKTNYDIERFLSRQQSGSDSCLSESMSDSCDFSTWQVFSLKNLGVIVDMWESCERICLQSEKFVSHLRNSECLKIAENTLLCILNELLVTTKCDLPKEMMAEGFEIELDSTSATDVEEKLPAVCFLKVSLLRSLLTICSACYLQLPLKLAENGVQIKMWTKIKSSFHACTSLPSTKLKTLFDVLLSAAMPKKTAIVDYTQARSIYQMFIKDDEIEDEEVRQLLQLSSDDENDSIFVTDLGYDADTECSSDRKEIRTSESSTQRAYYASLFRLLVELLVECQQRTSGQEVLPVILLKLLQILRANHTAVMAVCNEGLLLDILTGFWKHLTEDNEINKSARDSLLSLVQLLAQHRLTAHELQKILQLFHFSKIPKDLLMSTVMSVVENSMVQPYFSVTFPSKSLEHSQFSRNGLNESASYREGSPSFQDNIGSYKGRSSSFKDIAPSSKERSLSFKEKSGSFKENSPSYLEKFLSHGSFGPSAQGLPSGGELTHKFSGDRDTMSDLDMDRNTPYLSAVCKPLKDGISWPPIETGFTVALWIQFNPVQGHPKCSTSGTSCGSSCYTSSTDCSTSAGQGRQPTVGISDCLHLYSVGSKDKLFEVWADCNNGHLIFRLSSEAGGSQTVVKEIMYKEKISPKQWHHIVIAYVETLDSKKQALADENTNTALLSGKNFVSATPPKLLKGFCSNFIEMVTVTIDGWRKHELTIDHPVPTLNTQPKDDKSYPALYIGHTVDEPGDITSLGQWSLGSLMLLKGTNLSSDACFHLYSLGPSYRSVVKSDCSDDNIMLAPSLTKQVVLHSTIPVDILTGVKTLDLTELRASIRLHYSPWQPHHICLYNEIMGRSEMSSALASNLGLPPQQRFDKSQLSQHPVETRVIRQSKLTSQKHFGLEKAIIESGGMQAILFLTAKVFEENHYDNNIRDEEQEILQSRALHLLFTLVNHSTLLAKDYIECYGHSLLTKVMTSSRSVVGFHTLKVLMDASTTEPVFRVDPDSGNMVLRRKSEAMVKNVSIITELVLNWRIWEGAEEAVDVLIFYALASLVREDHPHQQFNVKQFQSVNVITKIFSNYQERIQDGCPSFSEEISQCVISILQSMMGTPPDLHLIVSICDFLLLAHPAANSYISHSQDSFYFSLWWDSLTASSKGKEDVRSKLECPTSTSTPMKPTENTDLSKSIGVIRKTKKLKFDESKRKSSGSDTCTYPNLNEISDGKPTDEGISEKETETNDDTEVPATKGGNPSSDDICDSAESALSLDIDLGIPVIDPTDPHHGSMSDIETVSDLEEGEGQREEKLNALMPGSSMSSLTEADFNTIDEGKNTLFDTGSVSGGQSSSHLLSDTESEFSIIGLSGPKTEVHFDKNIEILENEKGLIALCIGLLQTLVTIVVTLPDNLTEKVLQKVIKSEILIVLAHNSSPEIRTAVLRLLNAYLSRVSAENIVTFLEKNEFHLLGAQLYQYPTHEEQVQEVMSLLLGKPFSLQDKIDMNVTNLNDLTEVQQSAIILYLSLLENTISDVSLCHNCLCIALQLFESVPLMGSLMLENGFLAVLCNMVARFNRAETKLTDLDGINEKQIILEDLQTIICSVAVREFSASGSPHQQQFDEIMDLLYYLELKEQQIYGARSIQVQTLKALQLSIILHVLHYVEKASQDASKQTSGWFSRQFSNPALMASDYDLDAQMSQISSTLSPFTSSKRNTSSSTSLYPRRSLLAKATKMKPSISESVLPDLHVSVDNLRSVSPTPGELESSSRSSSTQNLYQPISRSVSTDMSKLSVSPKSGFSFPFFGKKRRLQVFPISQSELIDRFKKIITTAVDLIVYSNKNDIVRQPNEKKMILLYEKPQPVAMETSYIKRLFDFLYRAYEMTLSSQDKTLPRRIKNSTMWGAKDVTRVQLGRLMVYMMSTKHEFDDRTYVLSYMLGEVRGQDILKILLTTQELGNEMAYYLHNLLTVWEDWCNSQQRADAFKFLNIIKRSGFTVVSPSVKAGQQEKDYLKEEKKQIDSNMERGRLLLQKKREPSFSRLVHKNDKLYTQLSALAMEVTQLVTQLQTLERNKFVEHIKRTMTEKIQIKKSWQQIVQNLTHERAVWYCPESYPCSWQLDPTEGPGRVRKRLKRCHLGIESRFLAPEYRHKLESETKDPPLIYLFEDDHQMSDSAALIYQLYRNEKIQHTYKCTAVSPNSESRGELLVGENSVFFVADEAISDANYTQVLLGNKDQLSMTWPYEDIREIHRRWFQLRDIGIEIFLTSGKTCLLACQTKQDRDSLYQHIKSLELPNLVETENLTLADIQKSWVEGHMTNFDYLTHLNKLSGRSFNDLMQYPVFPFILKEYTSDNLNLKNPDVYRNLSKPISVQEKSREQKYKDNYRMLEEEYRKSDVPNISGLRVAPYNYGSHYSNSGSVLHFLVRLPPYTKMFLNYQDNNFDIPDRTFHSMQTTWRLASFQSTSDAKELIPEFFFLPEFFLNFEGFHFGKRQNGETVWDIQLPDWCKRDPRLFTLIHRQALESEYVSQNLHNWIDLVFGFKQQGEAAVKAINVFHPATYFGIDVYGVKDPVKRHALKTMVKTYGQTPKQLFRTPHPPRMSQQIDNPVSSGVLTQLFQSSFSASSQMDQGHLPYIRSPLPTVSSLKWGSYVGSPHLPPPSVVWQEKFDGAVASLEALPTGDVFGVGANSCCLMMHSKEKVLSVFNITDVVWAAIVSWQYSDGILRIKNQQEKPRVNFIHHSSFEQVTCCASVPDCRLLFMGGTSGLITIYQTVYNQAKESQIQVRGSKNVLHGHKATVNTLVVCKPYSVLVSGSDDHTCIIWDLNRLCYVRSITSHQSAVKVVAISSTLGDIASSSPQGMGSKLYLHTINADLVASNSCDETIHCLAFSSAPEGKSVNIIAGGLSNGAIRTWSSWDLTPLRDLQQDNLIAKPVISLTFTHDSQRLYMSTSDGTVSLWESPPYGRLRPHTFTAFL